MIKGYSGVFRLGEATSTLDADSPVLQRPLSLFSWFISPLVLDENFTSDSLKFWSTVLFAPGDSARALGAYKR